MTNTRDIEALSDKIAAQLKSEFSTFEGFAVRIDAGEAGLIYVALRQARDKAEVGEKLASALANSLTPALKSEPHGVDFAISMGSGNRDLLLQIELRYA